MNKKGLTADITVKLDHKLTPEATKRVEERILKAILAEVETADVSGQGWECTNSFSLWCDRNICG
jgi:hypothetical protein